MLLEITSEKEMEKIMTERMLSEAKQVDRFIVTEKCVFSVSVRYREAPYPVYHIGSFDAVQDLLGNLFEEQPYEVVYAIALDNSSRFLGFMKIAEGTVNQAKLYLRKILTFLLLDTNATGLILAHNHPGGTAEPSKEDVRLTEKMKEAVEDIEVRLLDHVIYVPGNFGKDPEWVSLLELGYIK